MCRAVHDDDDDDDDDKEGNALSEEDSTP